ncbi:MAG TPA: GNAT family N-acetyltransferase [Ktedonobacterales bacterium]|jgi:ribosomal protein S18 acetylase RimI-like enzyme|nr:GNAT family N-acetyltransferase [Ktedonobacterales bacterium]
MNLPNSTGSPVTFRPLRDLDAATSIADIRSRCASPDGVDPSSTLEYVPSLAAQRANIAHALEAEEQENWRLVEAGVEPVACGTVTSWAETDSTTAYLSPGWVLPDWRNQGIGTALLRWAEDRARRLAALQPNGGKAELAGNASETEVAATALLRDAGYEVAFTMVEMEHQLLHHLDEPPLPDRIAIRPAGSEQFQAIGASVAQSYHASRPHGRFDVSDTPDEYAQFLAGAEHDPTLWQAAWDGDQVAGQVLSVVERGRAEVFEVSVHPGWRRQGLARALLTRGLNVFYDRGVEIVRLHTQAEHPDRASVLYESAGFRTLKRFSRYRKPL